MEFRILGPLEVRTADGEVSIRGTRPRTVLAVLLLHANEAVSAERLASALWGEDAPRNATKAVQVYIARVRKALGDHAQLTTTPGGYRLEIDPGQLDAVRFDQLLEAGRGNLAAGRPADAAAELREALELWRGRPLADLEFEPGLGPEVAALEDQRVAALEERIEADLALGDHPRLAGELRQLIRAHPLRERLRAQLMLALYRSGRQVEALEVFASTRRELASEVGLEPGPQLQRLHEAMLRHDRSLELRRGREPLADELRELAAALLVGRDTELGELRAAWDRVQTGGGELVLIYGMQGMGKSRLAAALAVEVDRQGAPTLYASASEGSPRIVATLDAAEHAQTPLLLVLDDIERQDAEARAALVRFRARLGDRRALVIATAAHDRGGVALGPHKSLQLLPLGAVEAAEIAASCGLPDLPEASANRLADETAGVPRQIHELATQWAIAAASRRVSAAAARAEVERNAWRDSETKLVEGVVDLQVAGGRTVRAETAAPIVCPFKGLAPYEAADAEYFFGRERLVAEIIARLVGTPLLGIVGASGSGKSSVLRAGVVPALRGGILPGSSRWSIVTMRPGDHPVQALRRAEAYVSPAERRMLVVDQFEETFTTCRDEGERRDFIAALGARAQGSTVVAVAVRADFYERCAHYPQFLQLLSANHLLVGPMNHDELLQVIERPAERVGLEVETALTDALVSDVEGQPGALPLLSTALLELWQRRTDRTLRRADYDEAGGVQAAVARLAESAYERLSAGEQTIARQVLLRLAGEGPEGAVVSRRLPLREFASSRDDGLGRVIASLTERRLLSVTADTVEVTHEALLREWPRLRTWLREDAAGRRVQQHLMSAARDWHEGGRDSGDLYRGARLTAAAEWRADHDDELNAEERAFLDASERAGARTQRRLTYGLTGMAVLLLFAALAALAAVDQQRNARDEARVAEAQRLGAEALREKRLDRALLLARQGVTLDDSVVTRSNLLAALLRSPAAVSVMRGSGQPLRAVDVSPDGRTLVTGDTAGSVRFYDAVRRRPLGRPYETCRNCSILDVRFSPDGSRLAVAGANGGDGLVHLLNASTQRRIAALDTRAGLSGFPLFPSETVVFTADSRTVIAASAEQVAGGAQYLMRWDARSGRRLGRPRLLAENSGEMFLGLRRGKVITSNARDRTTTIHDARTGRALGRFTFGGLSATLTADGSQMAFQTDDGSIRVADLETGSLREVTGARKRAASLRFTPDRHRLLIGDVDGRVALWDLRRDVTVEEFEGHSGAVSDVAVSRSGITGYSASADGNLIAWDLTRSRRLGRHFRVSPSRGAISPSAVDVNADGSEFALPAHGGFVDVYESTTLRRTKRLRVGRAGAPASLAVEWPSHKLAATTDEGAVGVWDLRDGHPVMKPTPAHGTDAFALAFGAHGRWLVAGGGEGTLRLWDTRQRKPVEVIGQDVTWGLSFNPSGRLLAVTTQGELGSGGLEIYYVPTLKRIGGEIRTASGTGLTTQAGRTLVQDTGPARFTSDGKHLIYGDTVGRTWLFDTRSWKARASLASSGGGEIIATDVTSDNRSVVTASANGAVRLWDLRSRRALGTALPALRGGVSYVGFLQRGQRLLVLSGTGDGYLWDMRPAMWAQRACAVAGRTLTREEWRELLPARDYEPSCKTPQ